jgi:hypothetical protein
MLLVTLSQLQADVQLRADVSGSVQAYPLSEITDYINRAIARIHGILSNTGEGYYRSNATFNTTSGQQTYYTTSASGVPAGTAVLPTDIFRLEAVDSQVAGRWQNCERMNWERRNDFQQTDPFVPFFTYLYDYSGSGPNSAIFLTPPPSGTLPVRIWYYPVPVTLVSGTDSWDSANRWDEYVVAFAAMLLAERDQNFELVAQLKADIAGIEQAIHAEAASRVTGAAPKVRRSRYRRFSPWGWGGGMP